MRDLAFEFARLNPEQQAAVKHQGNTAVAAGPGSGKTATIVIKIVHLLASLVSGPRSIACITFNNDTVQEFRNRLSEYGVHAGRQLFLGTVHSFCLNCILRPYTRLIDWRYQQGITVAPPAAANELLERCIEEHMPDARPSWQTSTVTRYRRGRGCNEDTSGFDDRIPKVVSTYEDRLASEGMIDFESMVILALELLRTQAWARDLLVSRYAWLLVDEYQDLGGPLHQIVTTLADAGVRVFIVGDQDQTIYEFTGADPKYLRAFASRPDVKLISLRFNYRSGKNLIKAGEAVLSEKRGYEADPKRRSDGRVEFLKASDTLESHARGTVDAIRAELQQGTQAHEIAVFYQRKTLLLDELENAFRDAAVPYMAERATQYPNSSLTRWLQLAARWTDGQDASFEEIYRYYRTVLEEAGRIDVGVPEVRVRRLLAEGLERCRERALQEWLAQVDHELSLRQVLLETCERCDELEAFDTLRDMTQSTTMQDFVAQGVSEGKVVLTTLHSSKGRQFDAVIIPGLAEGIMPTWSFNRRRRGYDQPSPTELEKARRLFYVGFTRARQTVYLVYSDAFTNKGYENRLGVSRFALEISKRLSE